MMDLVKVEVLETSHTGVRVRILEGDLVNRLGFIRRAELSWDQRPDVEPPWPQVGDTLTAGVLGSRNTRHVRLSLRLGEPWQDEKVEERFHESQVVQGYVVQLSRYGAFVQLIPGVDALARYANIPLLPKQRLDEVLSVGDEVQAVITQIDPEKKQIEISLTERLRQLSLLKPEERRSFQTDLFQEIPPAPEPLPAPVEKEPPALSVQPPLPTLLKLERVLIVEDDEADRLELARRIHETFEVEVDAVTSGQEAVEKTKAGTEYDLVLLDVNLGDGNAVEVAEALRQAQALLAVVFVSRNPLADESLPRGSLFVIKDQGLASLLQFIAQMRQKEEPPAAEAAGEAPASMGDFVRHLGMEAFARRSREELLQPMLHRLRLQTQVSQAIVFEVNPVNKAVSVVAADPPLEENAQKYLLDRLYYSPLQNVVEDEETYYETDTQIRRRHPRFKRLYRVLPFRSCLGLPLIIPEMEVRHALFLFDEKRPRLELEDLDSARLAARFLQVALERAAFFDFMQRYERRYSRGLMVNSLMHELAIKLNTLNSLIATLTAALKKAQEPTGTARHEDGL